jgi:hypothetical protein
VPRWVQIRNSFHGTRVYVRLLPNAGDAITVNQTLRAQQKLCGVTGCRCGGGHCGPQNPFPDDEHRWQLVESYDDKGRLFWEFERR